MIIKESPINTHLVKVFGRQRAFGAEESTALPHPACHLGPRHLLNLWKETKGSHSRGRCPSGYITTQHTKGQLALQRDEKQKEK